MVALEICGWLGAALLVAAYSLHTMRRAGPRLFHTLNLLGALGVGASALAKGAWPATTLELVWAGIAVYGLAGSWRRGTEA